MYDFIKTCCERTGIMFIHIVITVLCYHSVHCDISKCTSINEVLGNHGRGLDYESNLI